MGGYVTCLSGTPRQANPLGLRGGPRPRRRSSLEFHASLDYPSVGEPVHPTKFLPMKTPMSEEIIENWSLEHPPKHVLTIRRLIESQEREHGRKVGLIIDLANHDCLYIDDLLAYNEEVGARREAIVEYVHVGLVAKELPPQGVIDQVQEVAREFWARKPESYICLHCCYGFNRTGYVMCSYLCQVHGMGVEESLESFSRARSPGVKHKKFVEALHEKYGGGGGGGGEDGGTSVSGGDGVDSGRKAGGQTRDGGASSCETEDGEDGDIEGGDFGSEQDGKEPRTAQTQRGSVPEAPLPLEALSRSTSADSTTLKTPEGSRLKFRPAARAVGMLTKSAPSSMRRSQTPSSRDLLGEFGASSEAPSEEGRGMSRSFNSTPGGILEDFDDDVDQLADTLKFNTSMRRSEMRRLAKALHKDFGKHDWHASELVEDGVSPPSPTVRGAGGYGQGGRAR